MVLFRYVNKMQSWCRNTILDTVWRAKFSFSPTPYRLSIWVRMGKYWKPPYAQCMITSWHSTVTSCCWLYVWKHWWRTGSRCVFFRYWKMSWYYKPWYIITEIETLYIGGNVFDWFRDYLCGRRQCVWVDNITSELRPCPIGVPQGSILGPIQFLLYQSSL